MTILFRHGASVPLSMKSLEHLDETGCDYEDVTGA